MRRLSRRGFFRGAAAAGVAGFAASALPNGAVAQPASFSRVVDLTHTLDASFPTFSGAPAITVERVYGIEKDGYNLNRWTLEEHVGTHMDAPLHFTKDGRSADTFEPGQLVVPLAVLDVAAKAEANPDYQVSAADIRDWEAAHGRLPDGAAVAMNSGWDRHLGTPKFRNADAGGAMHFPGFGRDAAEFMINERRVTGILVDTLSLDHGASKDFATHLLWLPSGRWGLENTANLGQVPARGATLVLGGPKIRGATGGLTRAFALI